MLSRISILYLLLGGEGTIITLFTPLLETGINVREITFANLPSRYRRDTSWHTWPDIISKSATSWIEFFPSRTRSIIDSTSRSLRLAFGVRYFVSYARNSRRVVDGVCEPARRALSDPNNLMDRSSILAHSIRPSG